MHNGGRVRDKKKDRQIHTERQIEIDRETEREEADELDVNHNSKSAAKGDLRGL